MTHNIQNRDLYSALVCQLSEDGFSVSPFGARPSASPVPEDVYIMRQWMGPNPLPERALRFWRFDQDGQPVALAEINNRQRDNLVRPESLVTFFETASSPNEKPVYFFETRAVLVSNLVGNEATPDYHAPHPQNLPARKPLILSL